MGKTKAHIKKSQKRHQWIVWMYNSTGNSVNPDALYKPGVIVSSRKKAKFLAERHANRKSGNKACWSRQSHNIRGQNAQYDYISFFDVTSTYHMGNRKIVRVLCDLSETEFLDLYSLPYTKKRYINASRNPVVIGKRRDCIYRIYSTWIIGGYLLEIYCNYFWTESEAQEFSSKISYLYFDKPYLSLRFLNAEGLPLEILAKNGEWLDRLEDDIIVKQIKPSAINKKTIEPHDYESVDMAFEDVLDQSESIIFTSLNISIKRFN